MYQHHDCTDAGCPADVRSAHLRTTLRHRAAVARKLHGRQPRLRARRRKDALGWARLRLDLIQFSIDHELTRAEFDHVRHQVLRSGRLPNQPNRSE